MSKSSSPKTSANNYHARLCHVVKRKDFDGYGFNLHAEKGRPGQFIGKVDEGSPAEEAGLRQGDRILEVNGTNIANENHKQVVERIKAIANETRLLVIDPKAAVTDDNQIVSTNNNVVVEKPTSPIKTQAKTTAKPVSPPVINDKRKSSEEKPPPKSETDGNITSAMSTMAVNGDSKKSIEENGNGMKAATTPVAPVTEQRPLNLQMTAAELRAKLAAKKKYDPKQESVDLRKKHAMIEKM